MKRFALIYIALFLVCTGCGKDDPQPPGKAALIFPEADSECTTGVSVNDLSSEVEFRWAAASGADIYELKVINLLNGVTQTRRTTALTEIIPLKKGAPYSWQVTTSNAMGITESDTWKFYNAGAQTNYAPFPAEIRSPGPGSSVRPSADGSILLEWESGDVDNDLDGHEVYVDTQDPPLNKVGETQANEQSLSVSLTPGTVYFWKVISIDKEGNTSDSGVYSFKVL